MALVDIVLYLSVGRIPVLSLVSSKFSVVATTVLV